MRNGVGAGTRAFVRLEEDGGPAELAPVLRALGLAPQPGPFWRLHGALLCASLPRRPSARSLEALRALPGVRAAVVDGDRRLHARGPGRRGTVLLRPERAWSDGAQSLSFGEFRALMRALKPTI